MADRITAPSPKIPRLAPAAENEDWMTGDYSFIFIRWFTSLVDEATGLLAGPVFPCCF